MKRSAIALGASVLALALTAGPASADAVQTVDGSTAAAQVGSVDVNAPVRVLSDGQSAPAAATATGPQATGDSTGSAQVGSVEADAPVRVLSDGDDERPTTAGPTTAGAGGQSTDDSTGSAQVGSPEVNAPVRVLSEGSTPDGDGAADAPPVAGLAPDEGEDARSLRGAPDGVPLDDEGATTETTPALEFSSGGAGDFPAMAGNGARGVETLGVAELGSLPLTGLGVAAVAALGLGLLAGGSAMRLVPGGKRR